MNAAVSFFFFFAQGDVAPLVQPRQFAYPASIATAAFVAAAHTSVSITASEA